MFGVKQILDKISVTLDLSLEDRRPSHDKQQDRPRSHPQNATYSLVDYPQGGDQ